MVTCRQHSIRQGTNCRSDRQQGVNFAKRFTVLEVINLANKLCAIMILMIEVLQRLDPYNIVKHPLPYPLVVHQQAYIVHGLEVRTAPQRMPAHFSLKS
ncbi:hypothetical protein PoB_007073600 [Plakobranchus ocellatus]|uniref:Uncharacterized protein n=1 Tax=Plakobranchus ocellatus TaxID=259542 RepID=A0AAV4DJU3_9GAST|nr:hypothetical protein PoB_007073600 [Plakobranchus ocellatus]